MKLMYVSGVFLFFTDCYPPILYLLIIFDKHQIDFKQSKPTFLQDISLGKILNYYKDQETKNRLVFFFSWRLGRL